MKCSQCKAETPEDAVFCPQCGRPVGAIATDMNAKQRFAAALSGGDDDEPEEILWQGRYSKRAMVGTWATAAVFSIALLILAAVMKLSGTGWLVVLGLILLAWLGSGATLFYRQMSIHYFLTNQRFLHEQGLLWREIDRIEAIDIDDVTFRQGPVERAMGVGSVVITSSDKTTPEFELIGIEDVRNVAAMIDEVRRQERRKRGLHVEAV